MHPQIPDLEPNFLPVPPNLQGMSGFITVPWKNAHFGTSFSFPVAKPRLNKNGESTFSPSNLPVSGVVQKKKKNLILISLITGDIDTTPL